MVTLLRSPWESSFNSLIVGAAESLAISSPFVGARPCERIREALRGRPAQSFSFLLLTNLSRDNMMSGSTDVPALLSLLEVFPSTRIRFLPSLHAKVYVADDHQAVITSSNLTDNGLSRNFEYGVCFEDPPTVHRIRQDLLDYAALGSPVTYEQLLLFGRTVHELRDVQKAVERSSRAKLRREFEPRLREAETDILRTRAAGRSPSAIFADAIVFLLRSGPASTADIHSRIQQIHPDLCNDAEDRIIDGHHFGKKWKHAVRTAQQHLKKEGRIDLVGERWQLHQ